MPTLIAQRQPRDAPDLTEVKHGQWAMVPRGVDGLSQLEQSLASEWPGFWLRYKISPDNKVSFNRPPSSHVIVEVRGISARDYRVRKFVLDCTVSPDGTGEGQLVYREIPENPERSRWTGVGNLNVDEAGRVYYLFISVKPGLPVSEIRLRWHGDPNPGACGWESPWRTRVRDPAYCGTNNPPPPLPSDYEPPPFGVDIHGRATVWGRLNVEYEPPPPPPSPGETPVGPKFPNPGVNGTFEGSVGGRWNLPKGGNGNFLPGEYGPPGEDDDPESEPFNNPDTGEAGYAPRYYNTGIGTHYAEYGRHAARTAIGWTRTDDLSPPVIGWTRPDDLSPLEGKPTSVPFYGDSLRNPFYVAWGLPRTGSGQGQILGRWEHHTAHADPQPAEPSSGTPAEAECHIKVNFTVHALSGTRLKYKTLQVFPASDVVKVPPQTRTETPSKSDAAYLWMLTLGAAFTDYQQPDGLNVSHPIAHLGALHKVTRESKTNDASPFTKTEESTLPSPSRHTHRMAFTHSYTGAVEYHDLEHSHPPAGAATWAITSAAIRAAEEAHENALRRLETLPVPTTPPPYNYAGLSAVQVAINNAPNIRAVEQAVNTTFGVEYDVTLSLKTEPGSVAGIQWSPLEERNLATIKQAVKILVTELAKWDPGFVRGLRLTTLNMMQDISMRGVAAFAYEGGLWFPLVQIVRNTVYAANTLHHELLHDVHATFAAHWGGMDAPPQWWSRYTRAAYLGYLKSGKHPTNQPPSFATNYAMSRYSEDFAELGTLLVDEPYDRRLVGPRLKIDTDLAAKACLMADFFGPKVSLFGYNQTAICDIHKAHEDIARTRRELEALRRSTTVEGPTTTVAFSAVQAWPSYETIWRLDAMREERR